MILDEINSILGSIRDSIEKGQVPTLEIRQANKRQFDHERALYIDVESRRILRFSGSTISKEGRLCNARWFVVYTRLLSLIQQAIKNGKIMNKRDLYYQDVELFGSQQVVDQALGNIAMALQVPRAELNVVATSHGVVYGNLTVFGASSIVLETTQAEGPCSVPTVQMKSVRIHGRVDYVLVVEKDAVLKHVLRPNSVVITGKGFPDIATRRLAHLIDLSYPNIPIYGLVDSDPSGIQILSTYKFGSPSMAAENDRLVAQRIQFLGVSILEYSQGWVSLSLYDIRLAISILNKPWITSRLDTGQWKQQVQRGLFLGKKAELNVVRGSDISDYLDMKLDAVGGAWKWNNGVHV